MTIDYVQPFNKCHNSLISSFLVNYLFTGKQTDRQTQVKTITSFAKVKIKSCRFSDAGSGCSCCGFWYLDLDSLTVQQPTAHA